LVAMAVLCTDENDLKGAGEWFEKAIAAAGDDVRVRRTFAAWLFDRGRADEAKAQAAAAVKADPKSPEVRLVQGLIDLRLERYAEAEKTFEALHLEAPGNLVVSDRWARALAGSTEEAKHQRALQIADLNLRLNPNSPEALATRACVARSLGR